MRDKKSVQMHPGRVFTPLRWAEWLIEQTGAFLSWTDGASVLDPTSGEGAFLEAFLSIAIRSGRSIRTGDLERLHGIEIAADDKPRFLARVKRKYNLDFPEENIITADFVTMPVCPRFDILVGNPPWVNFTDLPPDYKHRWAPYYLVHGLVKNKKDVLLGASRADIAALILKKALDNALQRSGTAAFFLPLSIFFNSGANDLFRPYPGSEHGYSVTEIWDFGQDTIFEGIATRYGAARFETGKPQQWPVKTFVLDGGTWRTTFSAASDRRRGHWQRHSDESQDNTQLRRIYIRSEQRPRQGINTCGANDIYIFEMEGDSYRNGSGELISLESELMYPLMRKNLFGQSGRRSVKEKWILVPHEPRTGRPLAPQQLAKYKNAAIYLETRREALQNRKGTLIKNQIKRGYWWSLLGVGPYSFTPWKVAWESLGQRQFRPVVLEGRWQGNQALHAFCACANIAEANALCAALQAETVEQWLKSSSMEGTCNWAQPGRVSKLLTIANEQVELFGT